MIPMAESNDQNELAPQNDVSARPFEEASSSCSGSAARCHPEPEAHCHPEPEACCHPEPKAKDLDETIYPDHCIANASRDAQNDGSGSSSERPSVVLEARNLTLAWDDADPVAVGINLVVREGEIVCLVGKSGMGKTTILHALAGLTMPREGSVLLCGKDVTGQPGFVSYMLQKDLLLPSLTVIDNACLPLTLSGMPKAQARKKALPLIERFGLQEAAGKWPTQLSGGMRQRAAFLRTYLMGNDVVMLDEPFSALDAITRVDLRSWFADEARNLGLSTLMITHDADEACTLADRIYVLGRPGSAAGEQVPATIVGEIALDRLSVSSGVDFALTPQFLETKARLLALL